MEVINFLLVKWGCVSKHDYGYRLDNTALNVKLLNLNEMNTNVISIDSIWFALTALRDPLNLMLNSCVI